MEKKGAAAPFFPWLVVALLPLAAGGAEPVKPLALNPLTAPKPELPDAACQQRLNGWVDLEFAVMPDGTVANVRVTGAQPKEIFDAAAVAAVTGRTYPPQSLPMKMLERLPMSFADCRAEQLRAGDAPAAGSQDDCPVLAVTGRDAGDRVDPAESGRAVLTGTVAPVYLGPAAHCTAAGKTLKPGATLVAHVEYQGFSLVGPVKSGPEAAVWVRSNHLKDVDAPASVRAAACAAPGEPVQWIADYCMLRLQTDDEIAASACIEQQRRKTFASGCASNLHFKTGMCELMIRDGTRAGTVAQCVGDAAFKGRVVESGGVGR